MDERYPKSWQDKMVEIWQDRILLLGIRDTGALYRSVQASITQWHGIEGTLGFRFLEYGIYVDAGTGNGYRRGNGGDLEFLGRDYRKKHGLGKTRERRRWFSVSWAISTRVLANEMERQIGDEFVALFDNL